LSENTTTNHQQERQRGLMLGKIATGQQMVMVSESRWRRQGATEDTTTNHQQERRRRSDVGGGCSSGGGGNGGNDEDGDSG